MPVSLNKHKDIVATSVSILTSNNTLHVADEFTVTTNFLDTKADKYATHTVETSKHILDSKLGLLGQFLILTQRVK